MSIRFRMLDGTGDTEKRYELSDASLEASRMLGLGFVGFDVPTRKQVRDPEDITPASDVIWTGVVPTIG